MDIIDINLVVKHIKELKMQYPNIKLKHTTTWDEYFINLARAISITSKDPSTKIGCVIANDDYEVLSVGYNGPPIGVKECWERPDKYKIVSHAEETALCFMLRRGVSALGCTMYLMYGPSPCSSCTRLVIQSGISHIVCTNIEFPGFKSNPEKWIRDLEIAQDMLKQANVPIRIIEV